MEIIKTREVNTNTFQIFNPKVLTQHNWTLFCFGLKHKFPLKYIEVCGFADLEECLCEINTFMKYCVFYNWHTLTYESSLLLDLL